MEHEPGSPVVKEDCRIRIHLLNEDEQAPGDLLFLADPSEKLLNDYLKPGRCRVVEVNNELIGVYVLLATCPDTVELVNVAVREDVQGRGIGRTLVMHALETARRERFRTMELSTGNSSVAQLRLCQRWA